MKDYTVEEIRAKALTLWPVKEGDAMGGPNRMDVSKDAKGVVRIAVAAMYDTPGLTFDHLAALAEFFETKNINDDDRYHEGGCETCDYGSVASFTLTIRPETSAARLP